MHNHLDVRKRPRVIELGPSAQILHSSLRLGRWHAAPAAPAQRNRRAKPHAKQQDDLDSKVAHDGVQPGIVHKRVQGAVPNADDPEGHGHHAGPEQVLGRVGVGVAQLVVAADLAERGPHPAADGEEHEEHQEVADLVELLVLDTALALGVGCTGVGGNGDAQGVGEMGYAEEDLLGPGFGWAWEDDVAIYRKSCISKCGLFQM